ncbi:MAG TPA: hypothetical protein PLI09_04200 [Candidatus Hydrogenedentes bacterium]|nr:hypothetical protein [Candidatus Hydrogenedentota bacterium]
MMTKTASREWHHMSPVCRMYKHTGKIRPHVFGIISAGIAVLLLLGAAHADQLTAGAAKVDITGRDAGPVNDPLYVKALVIKNGVSTFAIITVDAVAIGEIGKIGNDYLPTVRARLEKELNIPQTNVLTNASHCHGVVCEDVVERTIQAVKEASQTITPVNAGAGSGHEDRIMENRRYALKGGGEADSRHAYSLPPDEDIAGIGPIDPEIGVLRLDRTDGQTLAVVYNFACHPIQGVPSRGNTADIIGFASKVIEDNAGAGTIALFLQGCAGDINPAHYKDVDHPRDAEPLGNLLGLSTMHAFRKIQCKNDAPLKMISETIELPRADHAQRIARMEAERERLLQSLKGASLNLKTFLPLVVKYGLSNAFPSGYAHRYLHEETMNWDFLKKLDAENRENMHRYIENIHTMEELTRVQTNLDLLRKHQADNAAAGKPTVSAEIMGVRIGDFVLVTFPGEPSVQIGLNIKKASPHALTFVTGCTNGYLYYAPTEEQLRNERSAQEDSDCILAPEWQAIYEDAAARILKDL